MQPQAAAEAARALEEQAARCEAAELALEDARRAGLAFYRAQTLATLNPGSKPSPSGSKGGGVAGRPRLPAEEGLEAPAPVPLRADRLLRHLRERLRSLDGEVGKYALKAAAAKVPCSCVSPCGNAQYHGVASM